VCPTVHKQNGRQFSLLGRRVQGIDLGLNRRDGVINDGIIYGAAQALLNNDSMFQSLARLGEIGLRYHIYCNAEYFSV
jgi:hypothetical protein